jgi:hypothetical protein
VCLSLHFFDAVQIQVHFRWPDVLFGLSRSKPIGSATLAYFGRAPARRNGERGFGFKKRKLQGGLRMEPRARQSFAGKNSPRAVGDSASNKVAARRYERATVMFIDFVGFTQVAEQLSPIASPASTTSSAAIASKKSRPSATLTSARAVFQTTTKAPLT